MLLLNQQTYLLISFLFFSIHLMILWGFLFYILQWVQAKALRNIGWLLFHLRVYSEGFDLYSYQFSHVHLHWRPRVEIVANILTPRILTHKIIQFKGTIKTLIDFSGERWKDIGQRPENTLLLIFTWAGSWFCGGRGVRDVLKTSLHFKGKWSSPNFASNIRWI